MKAQPTFIHLLPRICPFPAGSQVIRQRTHVEQDAMQHDFLVIR